MRPAKWCTLLFAFMLFGSSAWASADYAADLRAQITQIKQKASSQGPDYFHDMGIVVRKADDAGETAIVSEALRGLFEDSDLFVQKQMDQINDLFEREAFQAGRKIPDLTKPERYFQPSENFLNTALGRALNGDLIQFRANAIESLSKGCTPESTLQGIQAIKKTGLFVTNSPKEIEAMRVLTEASGSCFSWKPEIVFIRTQPFETLYEAGTLTEEAHLRLESSRTDLSQAKWVGDWVFRYTGRDGKGEGVSQAVLTYHRGEDLASLVISTSRVSSTGRMNFPNSFSGEKRTMDTKGTPLHPQVVFFGKKIELSGVVRKK